MHKHSRVMVLLRTITLRSAQARPAYGVPNERVRINESSGKRIKHITGQNKAF